MGQSPSRALALAALFTAKDRQRPEKDAGAFEDEREFLGGVFRFAEE